MKNLKKVLALALAVIMVMSLFTVAFAAETETKLVASDFSDWADVDYKDAVALCVDLGIISGIANGDGTYKFAPKDSIDRASWAKLVYFIATGDDNADAYKGANVGMTDISTSWAEGFIAYCVANGFAAGDGLGHFLPTNTTTVAAGLKTLLNVLGYDPDDRGYQGTLTWSGSVMTDAKKNGLMDDVAKANTADVTLTREVAAQIIYNALQADTVEPEWGRDNGEKYVVKYNPDVTLGSKNFDVVAYTAKIANVAANGDVTFADNGDTTPFDESTVTGVKSTLSMLGETVKFFYNTETSKVVTTKVSSDASSAKKVIVDGAKANSLRDKAEAKTNKEEDKFVVAQDDWTGVDYYVNGAAESLTDAVTWDGGDEVKVYVEDGAITMIKVTTWESQKVIGDVETRTKNDVKQVRIPGVVTTWKDAEDVVGYEDLAKDDIVLVNSDAHSVFTLKKAEKVTGSVSSKKGTTTITIDGVVRGKSAATDYTGTANTAGELDISAWDVKKNKDNTYDFYLDINGDVVYVALVAGETETEVAYVLATAWADNGNGGLSTKSAYMEAKLLFTDGTTEIVTVAKVADKTVVKDSTAVGSDTDTKIGYDTASTGAKALTETQFVDFSVNKDGNYELTVKDIAADGTDTAIKTQPKFDGANTATKDTLFLVKKGSGDDATYHVFTGYANLPGMTATENKLITKDSVVTYAYIEAASFSSDGSAGLIYVLDKDNYTTNSNGDKVYEIIDAEGNEDTLAITGTVSANGFAKIKSTDEDGVATLETVGGEANKVIAITGTLTVSGDVVVNGSNSWSFDSDSVAVVGIKDKAANIEFNAINLGSYKTTEVDSSETNTLSGWALVSDNVIEYIYIVEAITATPNLT